MTNDVRQKPVLLMRDGVRLAHFEAGPIAPKSPPLLLIHGWTGDPRIFAPQIAHFAERRRVVAVNLRGHGASDAPEEEYTPPGFADDIAWQCGQLGLPKPVVIGHSMGGAIALELCARYPDLALGLLMIDAPVTVPPAFRNSPEIRQWLDSLGGPDYPTVSRSGAWDMACDFDDPRRRKAIYDGYILPPCEKTPQHVAFSPLRNFIMNYDQDPAANACKI